MHWLNEHTTSEPTLTYKLNFKMYTNEHRYFMQFLLQNSYISLEQASEFYKKIPGEQNHKSDSLKQLIDEINQKVCEQGLRIVQTKCDLTGEHKVILINTCSDNVTQILKMFTPSELVYFQVIIKELTTNDENKVPYNTCLNSSRLDGNTLKEEDAQRVLDKWIDMGYFVKIEQNIHFGSRGIVELIPLFHQYYKDYIKTCNLCSNLVFSGHVCDSCKEEFHRLCMKKFLVKHTKCPNCTNQNQCENEDIDDIPGPSTSRSRKKQRLN